jgi:hypothetical protein
MRILRLLGLAPVALLLAAAIPAPAGAKSLPIRPIAAHAAEAADDEVVLPSRVANAITRAQNSANHAAAYIDAGDSTRALASLKAVQANVLRADRAARRQMNAVPADPEAETTPGPDAVVAVLTLEQSIVTTLVDLFDTRAGAVVDGLTHALFATMNTRDRLLKSVIALDPEGAGADYSDGMADTLDGYTDEVANITEALADDTLSAGSKTVLRAALKQSTATLTKVTNAFGGGE